MKLNKILKLGLLMKIMIKTQRLILMELSQTTKIEVMKIQVENNKEILMQVIKNREILIQRAGIKKMKTMTLVKVENKSLNLPMRANLLMKAKKLNKAVILHKVHKLATIKTPKIQIRLLKKHLNKLVLMMMDLSFL